MTLISPEYRAINAQLHDNPAFGVIGQRYAERVGNLMRASNLTDLLDYGCGKATLAKALAVSHPEITATNYDPAIPEYSAHPTEAHDFVACTDVLEHIEPAHIDAVLDDIARLTRIACYLVISKVPSSSHFLPDGRNPHLIVEQAPWWHEKLASRLDILSVDDNHPKNIAFVCATRGERPASRPLMARRWHVLTALAKQINAATLIEVGCKDGANAARVLAACPDLHYTGIDPWQSAPERKELAVRMDDVGAETYTSWNFDEIAKRFGENAKPFGARVHMLRMTSVEAARHIADRSTDLIFIDGAHDEANVTADIRAWLPKVRPGGVLCGHDYQQKAPGVMRGVAACFNLLDIALAGDSVWAYFVPEDQP